MISRMVDLNVIIHLSTSLELLNEYNASVNRSYWYCRVGILSVLLATYCLC